MGYKVREASIVTGEVQAHNTFECPDLVKEEGFTSYKVTENGLDVELPAASVTMLRLDK
jgi:alpha-N-arabinofuranosidase